MEKRKDGENLSLARANDNAFGMFRQMLAYKQEKKGHTFIKINKKYPSSGSRQRIMQ